MFSRSYCIRVRSGCIQVHLGYYSIVVRFLLYIYICSPGLPVDDIIVGSNQNFLVETLPSLKRTRNYFTDFLYFLIDTILNPFDCCEKNIKSPAIILVTFQVGWHRSVKGMK